VFGAIVAPVGGEYGDEEGHLGSASGGRDPQAVFSKDLKKALAERVLNAKLADHLESDVMEGRANRRNGYSKTVLTENAKIDVRIPRCPAR
jgi:transposase-like protein